MPDGDQLIFGRIPTVAKRYDVSAGTVRAWMKRGLPHSRLGCNLVLIKFTDVDDFLERFREKPAESKIDKIVADIMKDMR